MRLTRAEISEILVRVERSETTVADANALRAFILSLQAAVDDDAVDDDAVIDGVTA